MIDDLRQLFMRYNNNGTVKVEYDTELYWGNMMDTSPVT